jgi:hypothetical protein
VNHGDCLCFQKQAGCSQGRKEELTQFMPCVSSHNVFDHFRFYEYIPIFMRMPKPKLGLDLNLDDSDSKLTVNKEYAKNYTEWRKKEELQKCKSSI